MKRKLGVIILMISLSVGMIACGNNDEYENISTNENNKNFSDEDVSNDDLGEWGFQDTNLDEETMEEIVSKKNKDVEMQINTNGYEGEELDEQILPTVVYLEAKLENSSLNMFTGNIYDIQDDFIYVITCSHGLHTTTNDLDIPNYGISSAAITFITGERIHINLDNIILSRKWDMALIAISTKDISSETLSSLKSINVSNMYKKDLTNEFLTGYRKDHNEYIKYIANVYCSNGRTIRCKDTTIERGCSGGGAFDKYGFYYGYFIVGTNSDAYILYKQLLSSYYDLIISFNPNY